MNIRLINSIVTDLELKRAESKIDKNSFDLSFSIGYNDSLDNRFMIDFLFILQCQPDFFLSGTFVSYFEIAEKIDEKFMKSQFPKVNAPAIAFPFLRTFISNLMLNAGYNPVVLPSINFTKFKNIDNRNVVDASVEPPANINH